MIYCIEDDSAIRDLMMYTLRTAGFDARGFGSSAGLYEALKSGLPQLILLDLMLPGEDGIAILKKLKSCCYSSTEILKGRVKVESIDLN